MSTEDDLLDNYVQLAKERGAKVVDIAAEQAQNDPWLAGKLRELSVKLGETTAEQPVGRTAPAPDQTAEQAAPEQTAGQEPAAPAADAKASKKS